MIFGNDLDSEHLKLFVDISTVKEQQKKKRGGMEKTRFLIIRVNKNGNLFFPLP